MKRRDFVLRAAVATERRALFALGEVSTTRSALERLHALGLEPSDLIARHQVGDWGDIDDADVAMNEESLHEKQRFFSSYDIEEERFWVLTSADHSRTIVFLPGDSPPERPPADPSPKTRTRRGAHLIQS
jgi:hypothetical protein